MYQQQQKLDHVLFAGITHEPAIILSKNIIQLTQGHLHKVFFSDNGSTAIEVALKMAFQKFANTGVKRTKFLGFHGSYHGDTFGAMSVAKSDGFHQVFEPLMFQSIWTRPLTHHASYLCPNGLEDRQQVYLELVEKFERHQHELAGVIIEPLIQGAGGMLMQCPEFLQFLQTLCKKFKIPLILDEVFSGMGRIGDYFAFLKANLDPDIVCIAKGLTGGNLPLALTLAKQEFYDAFLHEDKAMALLHGHSFTGNPIACAAANATLKILQSENLIDKAKNIENVFSKWIDENRTKVNNARCLGAILAFELPQSGFNDYFSNSGMEYISKAQDKGLYLRTLGNTVYFVPPLVITENELSFTLEVLTNSL
ncbi:adenosylmethionine--8-amino-7-oxononanoate transaminase [Dolichospermum sp. ST_sed1]|nr:adenosylmethionine--8-amino-7-oxononanoate transaminase [Dolichospermum sp. ST_sed1]